MNRAKLLSLIALLGASCAHPVAPTGGPEDKSGPKVLGYSPANMSLNQGSRPLLHFKFSEWINPAGAAKVLVSPPLSKDPQIEISGPWLRIQPLEDLDTGTTYTFALSRNVQDFHGNALAEPFSLTLSTGQNLDSLFYEGRILTADTAFGALKGSFLVGLYPIGEVRRSMNYLRAIPDSVRILPRPSLEKARYQVAPDADGFFKFQGLKSGQYRLFAFMDQNANGRFDQNEAYSFAEQDLDLSKEHLPLVLPLAQREDSLKLLEMKALRLRSAKDSFDLLELKWNRAPELPTALELCPAWDSTLKCLGSKHSTRPQGEWFTHTLFDSKELVQDSLYWIKGLQSRLSLRWKPTVDSLHNTLLQTLPVNGAEGVDPHSDIELDYAEGLELPADSVWKLKFENQILEIQVSHPSAQKIRIHSLKNLPEQSSLRLWKVQGKDSAQILRWSTWDPKMLAQFTGQIDEKGSWTVQCIHAKTGQRFTAQAGIDGRFAFVNLPSGPYFFQYFKDENHNGRRDPGQEMPFAFGEAFVRLAQILEIKPGNQELKKLLEVPKEKKNESN